jgi:hypothetical protein
MELLENDDCLVWYHNPGDGRNLLLARELAAACGQRGVPLIVHHHDWWFDHHWSRWPAIRAAGLRTLADAAKAMFASAPRTLHVAANQADALLLERHFGQRALWLPDLTRQTPLPSPVRTRAARRWLQDRLPVNDGPVWLLPGRSSPWQNPAEALLLTRWLRPDAWLVVADAAHSATAQAYSHELAAAAEQHGWPLRLGVLTGMEPEAPTLADLLAACEVVLGSPLREDFGASYLAASAASRPLIARRLANIMPDLESFGFQFPQAYNDILIAPEMFDWNAERTRQTHIFRRWCVALPVSVRSSITAPAVMEMSEPGPVAFSRLTLTAQLEVLTKKPAVSRDACAPLNPFLDEWGSRAATRSLRLTQWPPNAHRWLGGAAFARALHAAVAALDDSPAVPVCAPAVLTDFISGRLAGEGFYPLLASAAAV